jgi:hypothetical protein
VQGVAYAGCCVMELCHNLGSHTHTQQPDKILRASLAQLSHSCVKNE